MKIVKKETIQTFNILNKKIILLLIILGGFSLISAQDFYETQWKKIAENYSQGQFKSSLPLIVEIQNKAIKDKNPVEIIRSLKAEFSIYKDTHDDPKNDYASVFFSKIQNVEKQLKGNDLLFFNVLELEFFENYFNNNSWKINQRTNVKRGEANSLSFGEGRGEDIETWTKLDFKTFFRKKFDELSLQDSQLQAVKLETYKKVFENNSDFEFFPTLFDWKTQKFIKFLQNSSIFTKDELKENQTKIFSLYDNLIQRNSGNTKLYFQHQKLNFEAGKNASFDKKTELSKLLNSDTKGDYKLMIAKDLAEIHRSKSEFVEAVKIIENIKKSYPDSKFLNHIIYLENSITSPMINISYEQQNSKDKPIHLVATHKNANNFTLKIFKVNKFEENLRYMFSLDYDAEYKKIEKNLIRTDVFYLENKKDYKTYTTSLEMKPLQSGLYIAEYVNADETSKFFFTVASTRIVKSANREIYQLVNRENGGIIANENLQMYNFSRYFGDNNAAAVITKTDQFGNFKYPSREYYSSFLVYQPKTQEVNFYSDLNYRDYSNTYYPKSQIFLDREIYRPGQIIYFKVIRTEADEQNLRDKVSPNIQQTITLYDVNRQKISEQIFTTNEFGSYTGSFVLPKDRLNGKFQINITDAYNTASNYKYFSVEEYKRPKFEIVFEQLKNEYKYGETIELKGKAVTFSGIPLDNTKVNFAIKKENIRWKYYWWYPREASNENTILGETKTNEKGEFVIKINLQKDENLKGIQVDNFNVNASVTDVNGETQYQNTDIKVATVTHYIKTDEISEAFSDETIKTKVDIKNYNEQPLKKSYRVKLVKLEEPKKILRNNFKNNIQNLPKFSREEFNKIFPHDRYDKYEDLKYWKISETVSDRTENTEELNLGKLSAGNYRLLLFNVEDKDTIKSEQNFIVWDKKYLAKNQFPFLKVIGPKDDISRGKVAKIYAYSAIPNAVATIFVQDGTGTIKTERRTFKNGVIEYLLPISADKKITQYNVQFSVVAYNDAQNEFANIGIKSDENPIKIELTTFRDKIEPNSKEKWSIKVSGKNKEKLVAEVLANMYDKSLDKFAVNSYNWQKVYEPYYNFKDFNESSPLEYAYWGKRVDYLEGKKVYYPQFNWFDGRFFYDLLGKYGFANDTDGDGVQDYEDACPAVPGLPQYNGCPKPQTLYAEEANSALKGMAPKRENLAKKNSTSDDAKKEETTKKDLEKVEVRKNLNETAFFYPQLKTDANGNVSFEFTSPEALTKWKLMFLAHTKDGRSATLEQDIVTQKQFSVTPNYPRFLREGDELNFQTKLSSLVSQNLSGNATFQILDAVTNEDISQKFSINNAIQNFNLNGNSTGVLEWKLQVPKDVSSIILKVVAKAGEFSDGEQIPVAVLPNRMLVTDAQPVFVKEGQTKTFILENLNSNTSTSVYNFSNTLELTTNPIWEIIFALPDLGMKINISSDDYFNKWFADVVGAEIFKANPKMKAVFDNYKENDLLKSNLEKNQELKQLLLEETPWVLNSQNETEQMNRVARLFDVNTMRNSIQKDWRILSEYQNGDGGFPWLPGFPSSYSSSLYILKNLGKMNEWLKENVEEYQNGNQKAMVSSLINYLDYNIERYWNEKDGNPWSNFALDYLDSRNYWEKDYPLSGKGLRMKQAVIKRAPKAKITDFTFFGLHRAALIFDNYGMKDVSKKLMTYLKETSTETQTQGIYWKQNLNDWGWYDSKAINHAGAIEAFNKLTPKDISTIEEAKIWLATQKEVNSWGNSRTTSEIIYTMLNSGKSWTGTEADKATVIWGGQEVKPQTQAVGYLKQTIKSENVDKNLATVTVTKPGPGIVQGGIFWQYYEDIDKLKSSESYISITREYYKKVKTTNGEELQKITENAPLKVGDKVTVRMILNTDRPMQYIHLKDMRPAGFEPLDVISGYQFKNSLYYYQATKDASTNFYIEVMPKGKYVFEYDLVCNASGSFSGGFANLQNYYAPQMNARTKGDRINISK